MFFNFIFYFFPKFRFFRPWIENLVIWELGFEISSKNHPQSRLEMFGKQKLGLNPVIGLKKHFFEILNLKFLVWLKDFVIFDSKIEFYVKKSAYSRLEMSGNRKFRRKTSKTKFQKVCLLIRSSG